MSAPLVAPSGVTLVVARHGDKEAALFGVAPDGRRTFEVTYPWASDAAAPTAALDGDGNIYFIEKAACVNPAAADGGSCDAWLRSHDSNGSERFRVPLYSGVRGTELWTSNGIANNIRFDAASQQVYVQAGNHLNAFSLDGALRWSHPAFFPFSLAGDGSVFVSKGSTFEIVSATGETTQSITLRSGGIVKFVTRVPGGFLVTTYENDSSLVRLADDGQELGRERLSGDVRTPFVAFPGGRYGMVMATGGQSLTIPRTPTLHVVDASGKLAWEIAVNDHEPAVVDDTVVAPIGSQICLLTPAGATTSCVQAPNAPYLRHLRIFRGAAYTMVNAPSEYRLLRVTLLP